MYAGSAVASGAWGACEFNLTGDEITSVVGVAGLAVAVLGFLTQFWFNWRRDQREQAIAAAKLMER
ncbi:hypothetical protein GCM10028796_17180 [Ramlibacter monticola]|uniref:Holin n=1 Tax=Ramlibacter monticola TaxID=1926872 RepID=A0A936YVV8_9BURK|nr:hypothetical protein [Ramlibacter monticola]MBL0390545.1 hypothetical protein [Ramlibacter monticola]